MTLPLAIRLSFGCAHEQECQQAEETAEAEAAEDAQGATQREARSEEARLRLASPSRQVETSGVVVRLARVPNLGVDDSIARACAEV